MTPRGTSRDELHRAPRDCPVCGEHLAVTRLGCTECGSEISGLFESCRYCALGDGDLAMLRVFLVSRGNMRELERFLGVSYPTARQRFADLLVRLGLDETNDADEADGADGAATPDEAEVHDADVGVDAADHPGEPSTVDRDDVLRRLAAGELDVDTAERELAGF